MKTGSLQAKWTLFGSWIVATYGAAAMFPAYGLSLRDSAFGLFLGITWGWMVLLGALMIWQARPHADDFKGFGALLQVLGFLIACEAALLLLGMSFLSGAAVEMLGKALEFLVMPAKIALGIFGGLWLFSAAKALLRRARLRPAAGREADTAMQRPSTE